MGTRPFLRGSPGQGWEECLRSDPAKVAGVGGSPEITVPSDAAYFAASRATPLSTAHDQELVGGARQPGLGVRTTQDRAQ